MNLEPAPRLPKWIFLAIDAGLLLLAFVIVYFAKDPYAPLPFVSAVLCAALAAVIGLVPFLIDFAADTAEAVQHERERINEQVARLHAATESLARAAAQIKAVEEAVHKSARDAETLPYRMQEKLAEFNEALAAKEESDREALETELEELRAANTDQLKGTAEKIAKAAADWAALEVATRKQLTAAEAALAKLQSGSSDAAAEFQAKIAAALKDLDTRIAALKHAAAGVPTTIAVVAAPAAAPAPAPVAANDGAHPPPPPAEPAAPAPAVAAPAEPSAADSPVASAAPAPEAASSDPAPAATEPPKPKKPRAPRKPKAEDTLLAMSADESPAAANGTEHPSVAPAPAPAEPEPASVVVARDEPPAAPASDEPAGEAPAASEVESSTSSDGATRLLATAYIGIGNKLFIRGDGPGLSWDHGIPMQFVSIGKWGWSTHDATGPVRCKLYKNDELASLVGELTLEAGRHTEVTAQF
ncbi:hypothetical protein [Oleiharenicola sp. Vm1]|uniref:hypothetical protein n=1 Tax=Oleiharenicola sp. Vm1 TaxID=3398393 RepID=UPI0039F4DD83